MIYFCHLLNDTSGSPKVLRQSISELLMAGEQGVLFLGSSGEGALTSLEIKKSHYRYRRGKGKFSTLFAYLTSQVSLYRSLSTESDTPPSLVYINTILPFAAAVWAKRRNIPVVYHLHEVSIRPKALRYFLFFIVSRCSSHNIYVSEDHKRRVPDFAAPCTVVYNSVSTSVRELGAKSKYEIRKSGMFVVLMLASPRDYKGIPEFYALASRFSKCGSVRFKLVLNGDVSEVDRYTSAFNKAENIDVFPKTEAPEIHYSDADVLLNLSRVDQWVETFGMTLIEAMSFGIPVIAPPVGGPSEIVEHGREGYLVDSRNIDDLEYYVRRLITDPSETLRMSQHSREKAEEFSRGKFAIAVRKVVDRVKREQGER